MTRVSDLRIFIHQDGAAGSGTLCRAQSVLPVGIAQIGDQYFIPLPRVCPSALRKVLPLGYTRRRKRIGACPNRGQADGAAIGKGFAGLPSIGSDN